ncbi:hypothetical protein HanXRQr2_Chr05g0212531 [Helianthus annuus]|uniref:Uncharacterized protein n=1 Tax=Helianthus annuus TaxID=4232 RepID=A0A9K3NMF0_HELAN|nr:hypothetical protein HanXRQr2_Chr05g0212531 [Helianthus annuus]KAJ0576814.1 hypothetical protein HanIR_Chr05g0228761 [Helianthus annuus]
MAFVGFGRIIEPDPPDDFGRSVTASATDTADATMRMIPMMRRSFSFDFDFVGGLLAASSNGSGSDCDFGSSLP